MRLIVLLVLLYVTPDLANPLVPGAFTFDPASSMDMSRSDEHPSDEPAAAHPPEVAGHPVRPDLGTRVLARLPASASFPRVVARAPRIAAAPAQSSGPQSPDADH